MSIHIEDLTVRFKNSVTAIDHADLDIPNGIFGLLGENGAGKTTLMRVLTTVLKPTNGMVTLDGILYSEGNYEKIQRKIGYLPQEIELYPNLTVQECLEYMGDLAGVPKAECRKRIDYYLKKTSLIEHRKKKMKQLSGGMKRRVGLVQALLNEPEFLIVDEPTTGLDPEERIRIRNLLVDFSENRTVLFSTPSGCNGCRHNLRNTNRKPLHRCRCHDGILESACRNDSINLSLLIDFFHISSYCLCHKTDLFAL